MCVSASVSVTHSVTSDLVYWRQRWGCELVCTLQFWTVKVIVREKFPWQQGTVQDRVCQYHLCFKDPVFICFSLV